MGRQFVAIQSSLQQLRLFGHNSAPSDQVSFFNEANGESVLWWFIYTEKSWILSFELLIMQKFSLDEQVHPLILVLVQSNSEPLFEILDDGRRKLMNARPCCSQSGLTLALGWPPSIRYERRAISIYQCIYLKL